MNTNTGELSNLLAEQFEELAKLTPNEAVPEGMFPEADKLGPVKRKDVVEVSVGAVADFMGCPCRVVHINTGKRRISISPIGKMNLK